MRIRTWSRLGEPSAHPAGMSINPTGQLILLSNTAYAWKTLISNNMWRWDSLKPDRRVNHWPDVIPMWYSDMVYSVKLNDHDLLFSPIWLIQWSMGEGSYITLFSRSYVTEFHRMKHGGGGFHRVTSLPFTEFHDWRLWIQFYPKIIYFSYGEVSHVCGLSI